MEVIKSVLLKLLVLLVSVRVTFVLWSNTKQRKRVLLLHDFRDILAYPLMIK
jgi:hypothetical protein